MLHEEGPVVVFAGGGTGGHLYPALAIARGLLAQRPDVHAWFVGASRGLEARVLPERGLAHLLLPVRGLERGAGLGNVRVLPALFSSLVMVAELFQSLRPSLVVVTGGYAGAPAGTVAVLSGIPLALQEQNSVPGVTTRVLARFARQVHVAFPETRSRLARGVQGRVRESGNPVRAPEPLDRAAARRAFGLSPEARVVLVVGGSQGSLALNAAVLEAVSSIQAGDLVRPESVELLWSTGPPHVASVTRSLEVSGAPSWVHPLGYIDQMHAALAAADLAVSRAGAMATAEFLAWGLPAVLVPLPTAAADHQSMNARSLEVAGAAVHLPEADLDGWSLWEAVLGMLMDPGRLDAGRRAALERSRPEAAARIAADLATLIPSGAGGEGANTEAARMGP